MIQLTEELVYELNETLAQTCFKVVLDKENFGDIVLKDARGLDSYIINLDNEWQKHIEQFFRTRNLKLMWNNTRCTFWLV